jgi:hypothetical protein
VGGGGGGAPRGRGGSGGEMERKLRVWRRIAESGGERERAIADGRTVHQKLCTSTLTSYRVVEIMIPNPTCLLCGPLVHKCLADSYTMEGRSPVQLLIARWMQITCCL